MKPTFATGKFRRRIGSPREALVLVGNLTFARLCFTLSLEPMLHRDLPGYCLDLDTLWQHSLATAFGAAFLVKAMGLREERDRGISIVLGYAHLGLPAGELGIIDAPGHEKSGSRGEEVSSIHDSRSRGASPCHTFVRSRRSRNSLRRNPPP